MDVCSVIKRRLEELGLEQKDLATAAEVTESYVSQLLARKKLPPAPDRTDIYEKMAKFLKLPSDRLSKLAELERLVTQKLLDVVKKVAKEELNSENWLHLVARLAGRSYEQMRVTLLEFLDTDVFRLSPENCVSFLDPLIESWDVDLTTFGMEIVLNRRIASGDPRRFAFVEMGPDQPEVEPGFQEFLKDRSLSGTASTEEIELLKKLRFDGKRPTSLYYYRELQSIRDPLHFRAENRWATRKFKTKGMLTTPK